MTEDSIVKQIIRENDPISFSELREKSDMAGRDLVGVLDRLFERGEIYEPQPDQLKIVPDCD